MIATKQKYYLFPYVMQEDKTWTIPDEIMMALYNQLIQEDKFNTVFYGGGIKNFLDFIMFFKSSKNYPVFVVNMEIQKPVAVAWLDNISKTAAFSHFTFLGERSYRSEISQMVHDYWSNLEGLKVIIGVIPESNETAIKVAKKQGYVLTGIIPDLCYLDSENKSVGGVILHYQVRR